MGGEAVGIDSIVIQKFAVTLELAATELRKIGLNLYDVAGQTLFPVDGAGGGLAEKWVIAIRRPGALLPIYLEYSYGEIKKLVEASQLGEASHA